MKQNEKEHKHEWLPSGSCICGKSQVKHILEHTANNQDPTEIKEVTDKTVIDATKETQQTKTKTIELSDCDINKLYIGSSVRIDNTLLTFAEGSKRFKTCQRIIKNKLTRR